MMANPRVALVHDWLTGYRGGEKVLNALVQLYPDAEIFTLIHVLGSTSPLIEARPIHTSFLQRLPNSQTQYRRYLPLFPLAIERLDFSGFDLVISTSHAVAKGCRPAPGAVHISYVHTPMRYVWDQFDAYFGPGRAGLLTRAAAHLVTPALRRWDVQSTKRVDGIIANSQFVSERCARVWGRSADAVVYPPVELDRFTPAPGLSERDRGPDGYALIVSALVPYKRIDLAVKAFNKSGRRLVVAGGGPELSKLSKLAKPNVELLGPVSDEKLVSLYQHCAFFILSGEEDFGIAPVEAQACGRPVLALGRGGALETIRGEMIGMPKVGTPTDAPTGVFFAEPTEESLLEALPAIDAIARDTPPQTIRAWAERFSATRFSSELAAAIARLIARKQA
jgi:glycosyltransferase involved in cell wall biosynthesis